MYMYCKVRTKEYREGNVCTQWSYKDANKQHQQDRQRKSAVENPGGKLLTLHSCPKMFQTEFLWDLSQCKKATIHQLTTKLFTSENVNVMFSGHNHLLTASADDPTL